MAWRRRRGLIALAFALATLPGLAPAALAADPLTLTTPFPSVTVSPGSRVSFDLKIATTTPARVDLALAGVPSSWTAAMHGGGNTVTAVQTDGKEATTVRLDVDVPADASGASRITVTATSGSQKVELPLDVKAEKQAGGDVTVTTDFPALKGSADQSFAFTLNVNNKTAEDLTYTTTAQGPTGWTVEAKPTGSSQAVTGTAKAGGSGGISVTAKAADGTAAGSYPIVILTSVGTQQIETDLQVEITGSYTLTLSTPNQVLTTHGPSGSATEQSFTITNTGTAPVTKVTLTASAPTNWKVDFEPKIIDSVAPGAPATVVAKITPANDAISGDYSLTVNASGAEAKANAELRFTVEASIMGALVGAVLIIAAIGGLFWVFRRYGRR